MNATPENREEKLEKLWTEFLEKNPEPELMLTAAKDLFPYRQKAWDKYMESKPSKDKLKELAGNDDYSQHFRRYPADELLKNHADEETLLWLIEKFEPIQQDAVSLLVKVEVKEKSTYLHTLRKALHACHHGDIAKGCREILALKLMEHSDTILDISDIFNSIPDKKVLEKHARKLLEAFPQFKERIFIQIASHLPHLVPEFWEDIKLLNSKEVSFCIVQGSTFEKKYKLEAGRVAVSLEDNYGSLFEIMRHVEDLREEIWPKFARLVDPHANVLHTIEREMPKFAKRARALMKPHPRTAQAVLCDLRAIAR